METSQPTHSLVRDLHPKMLKETQTMTLEVEIRGQEEIGLQETPLTTSREVVEIETIDGREVGLEIGASSVR